MLRKKENRIIINGQLKPRKAEKTQKTKTGTKNKDNEEKTVTNARY